MENKNIAAEMKAKEHETDVDAIFEAVENGAEPLAESEASVVVKVTEHDPVENLITAADSDIGIQEVYKGIETAVVDTYKAIEDGVVGAYKAVEAGAVKAFTAVEDAVVGAVFAKPGESVEDAKKRLSDNSKKH